MNPVIKIILQSKNLPGGVLLYNTWTNTAFDMPNSATLMKAPAYLNFFVPTKGYKRINRYTGNKVDTKQPIQAATDIGK
jgi:hypothetical protein